ncbi:hypothetical protein O4215_20335 [Rhodococcus maanshanensis]|uniref:hypothetical protein n=1 Tax=Rhodococcus maanshanensis TaxID=183556 RepID=UPI0022B5BACD|nr:hypothetical protein [Rhodococcus maanshanensis]MCZ4557914.1 hypothetical protein [Rhodococcus maanshanensis]
MIEADLEGQPGSTLPFQQADLPLPGVMPGRIGDMLTWDESQFLLVVTTGTSLGAVGFRAEEHSAQPPTQATGWEQCQEVSARFEAGEVILRDLDANQILLADSLISCPGRYRIRLYATGRDSGVELQEAGDDLVERYLMQLWPEDQERSATPLRRLD